MDSMEVSSPRRMPPKMIQIEAPCAMQEGYSFMATHNGEAFPVTVPPGGVHRGQAFSVPYGSAVDLRNVTEGTPFILNNAIRESNVGAWKDGLFDCCRLGPCHPTLLHSVFCPQILMAQGLTRLKLNWLGERAPDHEWKRTFVNVCWIVAFYWILTTLLSPYNGNEAAPWFQWTFYRLIGWAFTIYTWVVLTRLRRSVRLVFEIPVRYKYLGQLEDFCIAFWCGCCAVSQMARQTCDYDEHSGACFSVTGVASSSDPIATWTV